MYFEMPGTDARYEDRCARFTPLTLTTSAQATTTDAATCVPHAPPATGVSRLLRDTHAEPSFGHVGIGRQTDTLVRLARCVQVSAGLGAGVSAPLSVQVGTGVRC